MKISIDFIEVPTSPCPEVVACIRTKNLQQYLNELDFPVQNFRPAVANKALTLFVFATDSPEWDLFLETLFVQNECDYNLIERPRWYPQTLYKFRPEHLESLIH